MGVASLKIADWNGTIARSRRTLVVDETTTAQCLFYHLVNTLDAKALLLTCDEVQLEVKSGQKRMGIVARENPSLSLQNLLTAETMVRSSSRQDQSTYNFCERHSFHKQ